MSNPFLFLSSKCLQRSHHLFWRCKLTHYWKCSSAFITKFSSVDTAVTRACHSRPNKAVLFVTTVTVQCRVTSTQTLLGTARVGESRTATSTFIQLLSSETTVMDYARFSLSCTCSQSLKGRHASAWKEAGDWTAADCVHRECLAADGITMAGSALCCGRMHMTLDANDHDSKRLKRLRHAKLKTMIQRD